MIKKTSGLRRSRRPLKGEGSMRFTKMEGLGNDYLYFYGPAPDTELP